MSHNYIATPGASHRTAEVFKHPRNVLHYMQNMLDPLRIWLPYIIKTSFPPFPLKWGIELHAFYMPWPQ